jgi:L-threonylcarbamoyladenylate synthase
MFVVELSMKILPYKENCLDRIADESIKVLKSGGVIAYPTESFYALGVLATDLSSVTKLYEIKKRSADKPMPVIVGGIDVLKSIVAYIPDQAEELMGRFWPGPLTMIFQARDTLPEILTGGTGKVAVRIPGMSAALYLAERAGLPITATSANVSSQPPAEDLDAVKRYFDDAVDLVIDGGKAPGGRPSTIVDVTAVPPRTLRQGSILLVY